VETLYLPRRAGPIVGVSGYAVRPPQVRREKPRVSRSFRRTSEDSRARNRTSCSPSICRLTLWRIWSALRGHSCLQPARRRRHPGDDPHAGCAGRCGRARRSTRRQPTSSASQHSIRCPALAQAKSLFRGWDDPLISGIGWVSELIEIAGGQTSCRNCGFNKREGPDHFAWMSCAPRRRM